MDQKDASGKKIQTSGISVNLSPQLLSAENGALHPPSACLAVLLFGRDSVQTGPIMRLGKGNDNEQLIIPLNKGVSDGRVCP